MLMQHCVEGWGWIKTKKDSLSISSLLLLSELNRAIYTFVSAALFVALSAAFGWWRVCSRGAQTMQ
jgi:hypothetical protein